MSYPALKNLGVNRPHEISSYTLYSNNEVDTLRIRYTRQKGSLLPTVKKFNFPRRPLPGVQLNPGATNLTEISPALEDALAELTKLLQKNKSEQNKKAELIQELTEFEAYVADRISELKAEIEQL
ncbi:DUF3461 family protein [Ostreibacterium oceani]|uniref:DUF3461 family protein n=1 Tax=Ostreibacterium oceani TaxID=2654998 RepID=A0A6N7F2L2_9GAMM|nr:DUF3461 family protein [Ostreibacterium oceani]MPV86106.1 DUF3461 family protein [Ostreibacterium oceani]